MFTVRATRRVYQGRVVNLRIDDVELPNGQRTVIEVVEHLGGVALIAQPQPGRIVLVGQYRPAVGRYLWEVPAGKLEPGEDPVDCARKELAEETGYRCERLSKLWTFYTAPGFCGELIHLFVAEDLTPGEVDPEPHELIEVKTLGVDEAWAMVQRNEIPDAKTQIALGWLKLCGGTAGSRFL